MTKLEEVARAQAEAIFGKGCPLDADDYVRARAAIKAMREPTPEMIAEGWAKLKRAHLPKLGPGPGFKEAYQAAIDAALSEEGQ